MSELVSSENLVREFFSAYSRNDVDGLRSLLSSDISWHVPGHHPLSGTKQGIPEVLAFFDQIRFAEFRADPLFVASADNYVVEYHRGSSAKGIGIDIYWCMIFRISNQEILEVTNLTSDQHLADLFFHSVFRLKTIPHRLDRQHNH